MQIVSKSHIHDLVIIIYILSKLKLSIIASKHDYSKAYSSTRSGKCFTTGSYLYYLTNGLLCYRNDDDPCKISIQKTTRN